MHVLNLKRGWAYCAGLPRRFWGEPAAAQAIAPSPNGSELYIVDSMRGAVAVMNTRTLQIERMEKVDALSLGGVRTSAQVSVDGRTLFVGSAVDGSAVFAIDTTTLEVTDRWPMDGGDVSGLGDYPSTVSACTWRSMTAWPSSTRPPGGSSPRCRSRVSSRSCTWAP